MGRAPSSEGFDAHVTGRSHGQDEALARPELDVRGLENDAVAPHGPLAQQAHGLAVRLRQRRGHHERVRLVRSRTDPDDAQLARGLSRLVDAPPLGLRPLRLAWAVEVGHDAAGERHLRGHRPLRLLLVFDLGWREVGEQDESTDNGKSWTLIQTENIYATLESIDISGNKVCAAGENSIMFSPDFGDSWENIIDTGIIENTIHAIKFDEQGNIWVAGKYGFIYSDKNETSIVEHEPSGNPGFELMQNYPNPFNPTTNFGFRISNFGLVTIKIFDVLGNEAAELVNEYKSPGYYEIEFNGSNFASGIYFYSLNYDGMVSTKKRAISKIA